MVNYNSFNNIITNINNNNNNNIIIIIVIIIIIIISPLEHSTSPLGEPPSKAQCMQLYHCKINSNDICWIQLNQGTKFCHRWAKFLHLPTPARSLPSAQWY